LSLVDHCSEKCIRRLYICSPGVFLSGYNKHEHIFVSEDGCDTIKGEVFEPQGGGWGGSSLQRSLNIFFQYVIFCILLQINYSTPFATNQKLMSK
jgi:hypothetical protein